MSSLWACACTSLFFWFIKVLDQDIYFKIPEYHYPTSPWLIMFSNTYGWNTWKTCNRLLSQLCPWHGVGASTEPTLGLHQWWLWHTTWSNASFIATGIWGLFMLTHSNTEDCCSSDETQDVVQVLIPNLSTPPTSVIWVLIPHLQTKDPRVCFKHPFLINVRSLWAWFEFWFHIYTDKIHSCASNIPSWSMNAAYERA